MNPDIYALVQKGNVVNTVMATAQDFQDPQFIWIVVTNLSPQPSVGWAYDGQNFTPPPSNIQQNQPSPPQIQIQVNDPAIQAVLSDLISAVSTGDPSYVQKYVVAAPPPVQ